MAIARAMQLHAALPQTYSMISRTAVSTILGCEHAALSVVRRDAPPVTVGMTDMLPTAVDALQYECGQGPCLDVLDDQTSAAPVTSLRTTAGRRSGRRRSGRPAFAA